MCATVSADSVQSATRAPSRAAAYAASHPAWPAPITMTSKCSVRPVTLHFPMQNRAKMCASRSSGARRPRDLLERRARLLQIRQHEFLRQRAALGRARPRAARTSASCARSTSAMWRTLVIAGGSRSGSTSSARTIARPQRVEPVAGRRRHLDAASAPARRRSRLASRSILFDDYKSFRYQSLARDISRSVGVERRDRSSTTSTRSATSDAPAAPAPRLRLRPDRPRLAHARPCRRASRAAHPDRRPRSPDRASCPARR